MTASALPKNMLNEPWHQTPPPGTPKEQVGWYEHAFYVPGHGWYGGFPADLAAYIVAAVERARQP